MDSSEGVACPLKVTLLTDYGTPTWTIPADHKDHREIVYLLNFHSRMRGEAQYYDTGVSDSHEGYRGFAVEKIQGDPAAANTAPQTQVTVRPRAHNRLQHLLVESAPSLDQKVHQLVKRAANTYTSGREVRHSCYNKCYVNLSL